MPFRDIIVAGVNLVRTAIQSQGFLTGITGWRVEKDGTAEFNDATIRGELIVGNEADSHIVIDISASPDFVPFIAMYSGDSDEQDPAFITNDPIPASGRIPLTLLSSDRDDSSERSKIELYTGSDASPNDTFIELSSEAVVLTNSVASLIFNTSGLDIDGTLTYDLATALLNVFGNIEIVSGYVVPGRVDTTEDTSSSGAITTTETIVLTITAPLINTVTYRITAYFLTQLSVATDVFVSRLREDDASGTQLQNARIANGVTNSVFPCYMEVEYTATATGNKTFVVTLLRTSGTGNIVMNAGATQPCYLYIDYVRN